MKIFFVVLITGLVSYGMSWGGQWLENYRCNARWSESGLKAKTNFGCNVEIAPGKWVPESSIQLRPQAK